MSSHIIEVNQANFQVEVVQRSRQVPVIVDFWAPWCGPCRMIGPVLEKLAGEFNGRFILAKVNADHNPQLSAQFGIQGIPAVKAFSNGRVVDEFVGAQPEPRIRQFIQRLTANVQAKAPEKQAAPPAKDPAVRIQLARQLLKEGKGCEAQTQLQGFPSAAEQANAQILLPLAQFLCEAGRGFASSGIADLDIAYQMAAQSAQRQEYSTALYNLLAILNQNKKYRDGKARKVMLGLLELLGKQDPLTQFYQQYTHDLT